MNSNAIKKINRLLRYVVVLTLIVGVYSPLLHANSLTSNPSDSIPSDAQDRLVLKDGRTLDVDIINATDRIVYYYIPGDKDMKFTVKGQIEAIYHRDGSIERLSTDGQHAKAKEWGDVSLTFSTDDVKGLVEIGLVEAKAVPSFSRKTHKLQALEASAEILIRRRGAEINADIILITDKIQYVAYGDTPSVTLKGVAYRRR